jgi:type III secretory pathway component EscT
MGHRTVENMAEPGYRVTKGIVKTNGINLSWVWLGMMFGFFFGAFFFAIFAAGMILRRH